MTRNQFPALGVKSLLDRLMGFGEDTAASFVIRLNSVSLLNL